MGCAKSIREISRKPNEFSQDYVRLVGRLEQVAGTWRLVDESDHAYWVEVDLPPSLVRRMVNAPDTAIAVGAADGLLIRVSGATVESADAVERRPIISDFSFVQVLGDAAEARLAESVDGRGGTRCTKVYDLLGDYCLLGVSTIAIGRERYDGLRVSVRGYLRCGIEVHGHDRLYASADSARDEVVSDALIVGRNWQEQDHLVRQLCRDAQGSPVPARIIGRFSAESSSPSRGEAIGLLQAIERAWPLGQIEPEAPEKDGSRRSE